VKKHTVELLISFLLAAVIGSAAAFAQQPTPTPNRSDDRSDAQKRQDSFEIVWKTVNDRFYDPNFGGVDWRKVHERYAQYVAQAKTDQELHQLLQQMLNELHQSHFIIIPKEAIPKLAPKRRADDASDGADADELAEAEDDESATPLDRIGYKNTERLTTGIGIDLRVMRGSAVITRVEPSSAAARAGLRPGFVIKSVSGRSIDAAIAQFESNPTFHAVFRGEMPLIIMAGFINGERQSPVQINFLDSLNRPRQVRLTRERLKGEMSPAIGNLPAMYTEFESRRLAGGIGYIRFNAFVPIEMKKVCAALRSLHDTAGLIIDLRGNQGGLLGMVSGLSGLLETEVTLLGQMQTRTGRASIVSFPQRSPYSGPIVIIVDGSTQSAAEMFASGMQETGRAIVVGEQTAGNTLPSSIIRLPTGALFQYGFGNYLTLGGRSLEGRGITPDVNLALNRRALLIGADPQMAGAVKKIRELIRWTRPVNKRELIANVTVAAPPESNKSSKTIVTVSEPPEPPPPEVAPPHTGRSEAKKDARLPGLPSAAQVIDRYIEVIGGQAALEKLTSRVSKGTVELQSMGLSGTTEIYEQAPNRSSVFIKIDGLGTIQETFDGKTAWLQDPLEGYIKLPPEAVKLTKDAEFHQELLLKTLSPTLVVIGKEKVGEREAFVLLARAHAGTEKWYFDVENGLLLRHGNSYFEDYREVDGVRLPFKVSDDATYGFGIVVRLTEIKHNVAIDQSKFVEYPDCFTKP
jgi:carboxyl-terminal processing protease